MGKWWAGCSDRVESKVGVREVCSRYPLSQQYGAANADFEV